MRFEELETDEGIYKVRKVLVNFMAYRKSNKRIEMISVRLVKYCSISRMCTQLITWHLPREQVGHG